MARSVYATIRDLRAAGLSDETAYPDVVLLDRLELASEIVEAVTGQFFGPRRLVLLLHAQGARAVEEPGQNKIILVESVSHVDPDATRTLYPIERYAVLDRSVRLQVADRWMQQPERAFRAIPDARFHREDANVELAGVFGWLERADSVFATTLAAPLAKGALSVSLTELGDIEENDLLLIDQRFWVIAQTLTPGTPAAVAIDPSPKAALIDAPVVRYGQVPRLVREAVIRTVKAHINDAASDEELAGVDRRRIKREETDNYEVEFFATANMAKLHTGTGDPVADAILSRFRAPVISGAWI